MKNLINVFSFLVITLLSLFALNSFANPSAHGVLMVVKGDVQIQQKDKLTKAKVGAKVVQGDTILTGKDARAKLVMVDKNVINISPESKFLLEKYEYNPDQNKKGALLNVIYGKVRTTVNQKYDGDQNKFQVKTKSSVAGVRGTDFLVSFNQVTNTSKVVTFEGLVEVGAGLDAAGRIANPVSVSPGQFTVASMGTAPSAPVILPQAEVAALNEQSVAEAPTQKGSEPAAPGNEKKERSPSNNQPAPQPQPNGGSVMNNMEGADPSASGPKMLPPPPPPITPVVTTPTEVPRLPTTVDPTLIQGKTNLLINLQPNP